MRTRFITVGGAAVGITGIVLGLHHGAGSGAPMAITQLVAPAGAHRDASSPESDSSTASSSGDGMADGSQRSGDSTTPMPMPQDSDTSSSETQDGTTSTGSSTGMTTSQAVLLAPQPLGTTQLTVDTRMGRVSATFNASGITPGSVHAVDIRSGRCGTDTAPAVRFGDVSSDASGRLMTTTSGMTGGMMGSMMGMMGARVMQLDLHVGSLAKVSDGGANPVAAQVLACVNLPQGLVSTAALPLAPIERPAGNALLAYDPAAKTLTVTVHVTGLIPNTRHAEHIHNGTCSMQGSVADGLTDLTSNDMGVAMQTTVLHNIQSPPPAQGWYINIHRGDSMSILINGQPALSFAPLACGNVSAA